MMVEPMYGTPMPVRTFNSNFTPYEGENQSASQIRALKSAVKANNDNKERKVELDMSGVKLTNDGRYTVTMQYDDEGYIIKIKIEEDNNV